MFTIGGLPVFDALVPDEETGMLKISLVDIPAVMSDFLVFNAQREYQMYSIRDEEKRLVYGVVARANYPILRRSPKIGDYYIVFKPETIRKMAEKYLAESRQNEVSTMHRTDIEGVRMVQFFLKDSARGVNPEGFADIEDGSLFAEFHILNDSVFAEIKAGTYKGFSLEGVFDFAPEQEVAARREPDESETQIKTEILSIIKQL